jgi:hypothetical protein
MTPAAVAGLAGMAFARVAVELVDGGVEVVEASVQQAIAVAGPRDDGDLSAAECPFDAGKRRREAQIVQFSRLVDCRHANH